MICYFLPRLNDARHNALDTTIQDDLITWTSLGAESLVQRQIRHRRRRTARTHTCRLTAAVLTEANTQSVSCYVHLVQRSVAVLLCYCSTWRGRVKHTHTHTHSCCLPAVLQARWRLGSAALPHRGRLSCSERVRMN